MAAVTGARPCHWRGGLGRLSANGGFPVGSAVGLERRGAAGPRGQRVRGRGVAVVAYACPIGGKFRAVVRAIPSGWMEWVDVCVRGVGGALAPIRQCLVTPNRGASIEVRFEPIHGERLCLSSAGSC